MILLWYKQCSNVRIKQLVITAPHSFVKDVVISNYTSTCVCLPYHNTVAVSFGEYFPISPDYNTYLVPFGKIFSPTTMLNGRPYR